MKELTTINHVLEKLDEIIRENEQKEDALGYFAILYRRVTLEVKEKIEAGYFEDPGRMELLDVIFAKKYIDAYSNFRMGKKVTQSWDKAFHLSGEYWPIILQHLLIGMNAHINLDLGIAAAQVSGKGNIEDLRNDFFKINEILASLVDEVQHNLSAVWPPLKKILQKTGQYDNLLVDFSMKTARDGAWNFAKTLANTPDTGKEGCVKIRDQAVAGVSEIITNPKLGVRLLLGIIRLGETGTVSEKMRKMKFADTGQKSLATGKIW